MDAEIVCMYRNESVEYPEKPVRADFSSQDAYEKAYELFKSQLAIYENSGIIYSTTLPTGYTKESMLSSEETEIDVSVVAVVEEMLVVAEIKIFRMLQNKHSVF